MANQVMRGLLLGLVTALSLAVMLTGCSTRTVKKDEPTSELIRVLSNPDSDPGGWNHRRAADLLGKRGAKEGVPVLIENLDSPNDKVVRSCTLALGDIGDPSAVQPLIGHLNGSFREAADPHVMGDCLISLGRLGAKNPQLRDTIRPNLEYFAQGNGTDAQARWAKKALGYWSE